MSNPSSPASSSSSAAQHQDTTTSPQQGELAAGASKAAGITLPDDDDKDIAAAELSPPRCEWEFRLAATVPSTALPGASDAIGSVDFDPTGRLLATGGIARRIRMYDVPSLLDGDSCAGGPAACICVPAKLSSVRWRPGAAPSPSLVGCGDYDGVVTEYDVERGVAAWERDEHAGRRVWSLDYAPGGGMAASGSDDRTAHVWDPRAPSAGWATARAGGAVLCVEFDPSGGPQLAVGSAAQRADVVHDGAVLCVEFDPSGGPQLAVGSADRRAVVYDVRALGRGPVAWMDGHGRPVTYVRWAGAARRVVTSAADGTHRLWEWGAAAAAEVRSYSGHASARCFVGMGVWRAAGLVASGSESNHVFVYDLRWAKPIWVHPFVGGAHGPFTGSDHQVASAAAAAGGGGFVSAVAWRQGGGDHDGGALVAGGSDGVLKAFTCQRRKAADGDDASSLLL